MDDLAHQAGVVLKGRRLPLVRLGTASTPRRHVSVDMWCTSETFTVESDGILGKRGALRQQITWSSARWHLSRFDRPRLPHALTPRANQGNRCVSATSR